jgi:predicted permease
MRKHVAAGMNPDDAERRARLEFGGMQQWREETADVRLGTMLSHGASSIRYAARALLRQGTFTATAVLTLALAIGATTAVFDVVNAVLVRGLPYREASRLIGVFHALPGISIPRAGVAPGIFFEYRRSARSIAGIAGYTTGSANLAYDQGTTSAERVISAAITANMLPVLGVVPLLGRGIDSSEDLPNAPHVALISESFWRRQFGANPNVLGQSVRVNGDSYRIVGVMPGTFQFPVDKTDLWTPLALDPATPVMGVFSMSAVARLRDGSTMEQAQSELTSLLARVPTSWPNLTAGGMPTAGFLRDAQVHPLVSPLRDSVVGDFARILWIIAGAAVLVFLAACANVSSLMLIRSQARRKEIAVRVALGAGRIRVLGQFFAEALVLVALGVGGALLIALGALRWLVRTSSVHLPRITEIGVDASTIAFSILVGIVAALICSAVPAYRWATLPVGLVLKSEGRTSGAGRDRQRVQSALVSAQVAFAVVLLCGSMLLVRTVSRLRSVPLGFEPDSVMTFGVMIPSAQYSRLSSMRQFGNDMLARLRARGFDAAITSVIPLTGVGGLTPMWVEGITPDRVAIPPVYGFVSVSPEYFHVLRIPLLAGRVFGTTQDSTTRSEVVVSRAFAQQYWHDSTGRQAIGKRIRSGKNLPWLTIAGVVGSIRDTSIASPLAAQVYGLVASSSVTADTTLPAALWYRGVVVRYHGTDANAVRSIREEMHALDATIPVFAMMPMTEIVARSMAQTSFALLMIAFAGGVTLIIGTVGLYGLIAYTVSLRTREIGIRVALGARPREIAGLVAGRGVGLAAIGVVVGVALFMGIGPVLRTLLVGVSSRDPLTLVSVSAGLLAVAAVASSVPARRASRVDPLEALQAE